MHLNAEIKGFRINLYIRHIYELYKLSLFHPQTANVQRYRDHGKNVEGVGAGQITQLSIKDDYKTISVLQKYGN